jgi:hypothetical protein
MKNLSKKITGLVIAASIISTGVVAMAATAGTTEDSKAVNQPKVEGKMMKGEGRGKGGFNKGGFDKGGMVKGDIENNLKSLVSAGVITQEESDKILALSKEQAAARQAEMDKVKNMTAEERKAYFETAKDKSTDRKGDIFTQAVIGGIITQEKADAAKAKLQETRTAEKKAEVTEGLAGLVTAGTISQDQADKVAKYMETLQANKPAKDAAAPEQKQEKKNPLSALVDDGTLTQAQLDEVSKVVHFGKGHGHGGRGGRGGKDFNKQATAPAADSSSTQAN